MEDNDGSYEATNYMLRELGHSPTTTRRVSSRKRRQTTRMSEYQETKRLRQSSGDIDGDSADPDDIDDIFVTCKSGSPDKGEPVADEETPELDDTLVEERNVALMSLLMKRLRSSGDLNDDTANEENMDDTLATCRSDMLGEVLADDKTPELNDTLVEERNAALMSLMSLMETDFTPQQLQTQTAFEVPRDAELNHPRVSFNSESSDEDVAELSTPHESQRQQQHSPVENEKLGSSACSVVECYTPQLTQMSKSIMDLAELDCTMADEKDEDCVNCLHLKETSKSLEAVIDQLALKLDAMQSQRDIMKENHHSEMAIIVDELKMSRAKENSITANTLKMQDDFKSQFNAVREELVLSEERNSCLTESLSDEKDRIEDLKKEKQILKESLTSEKYKNDELHQKIQLLQENLSQERDRNVALSNQSKVLKQQLDGQGSRDDDIIDIRNEIEKFKRNIEDRLNSLSQNPSQSSHGTADGKNPPKKSNLPSGSETKRKERSRTPPQSKQSSTTSKQTPSKTPPTTPPKRRDSQSVALKSKNNTLRFANNSQQTKELHPNEDGRCEDEDTVEEEKVQRINKLLERRNRRNRKTLIFGSSHAKSLQKQSFNEQLEELESGSADIYAFPGRGVELISKYMKPHLEEDCPHTVVLIAGGNDIPRRRGTPKELEKIAGLLIDAGLDCRNNYGVSRVCISSVLPRTFGEFQGNKHILNGLLKNLCAEHDFVFIDNSENIILRDHIGRDGIHLNSSGAHVFARNILKHLDD